MKLYHCKNSRSLRAIWAAEEAGAEIEVRELRFPPRMREREYLEVNPTGTIPAFFDGEVALFESVAICEYLAHRQGASELVVKPGEADWPHYLNFLHMGEATLTPPLAMIARYRIMEPAERRLPQAVADFTEVFHDRLRHVERRLTGAPYLAGERFTLADISVGYALFLAAFLRQRERFAPEVSAYLERMQRRPAFLRALERN